MRLAAIVSASYGASPSLPHLAGAVAGARAVHDTLSALDANLAVEWFEGRREFPDELERLLAAQRARPRSILLYFGGYLLSHAGRSPALALDGPRARAYPLPRLCALLGHFSDEFLILLDVAANTPASRPEALADAVCSTLGEHYPRAAGLVAVRGPSRLNGGAGFTELALDRLERLSHGLAGAPATVSDLFAELELSGGALARSHALRHVPAGREFVILSGVGTHAAAPAHGAAATAESDATAAYLAALAHRASICYERQDWGELAATYEGMLDYADGDYLREIVGRFGSLCRQELADPWRAIRAFERLLGAGVSGAPLHFELGELYAATGQLDRAGEHCLAGLARDPRDAAAYRQLAWLFARTGQGDRAWHAASVLKLLGVAEPDEVVLADSRRPEGLLPAISTLTEDDWTRELARPERDPALERVLRSAGYAAVSHRLQVLAKQRRLLKLDPAERQDLKQSTTTLCRTFTWTARLLSVTPPALYLHESEGAEMTVAPAVEPSVLVSKVFASGLTLPELAFLWGRQLTAFRPDHYVCVFFPSVDDLLSLLRACGLASRWDPRQLRDEEPDTARLAAGLHRVLPEAECRRLAAAIDALPHASLPDMLARFLLTSTVVANRAGLVACGDIGVAAEMIARFPVEEGSADPIGELLSWSVGDAHAELRRKLGVSA